MTTLFPPSLVEQLGWVLLHSVWQIVAVGLALLAALIVLRRTSPMVRYVAGLVAISAIVTAPIVTCLALPHGDAVALASATPLESRPAPSPAGTMTAPESLLTVGPPAVETPSTSAEGHKIEVVAQSPAGTAPWQASIERSLRPWLRPIVLTWCVGVLAFALRPLVSWHRLRRLRKSGLSAVPGAVETTLRRVADRLRVRRAVSILQSRIVQVPVVVGYLKPLILLPVCVLAEMPASQLEAILAHELAHVRRHDFLVNLLQTLVETVFFYHPVVWWVSRQIRIERENCCDDVAVAAFGDRAEYSRALLALEELRGPGLGLAVGAADGSLLARVRRLLTRDGHHGTSRLTASGGIAAGLALVLLAGVWAVLRANPHDAGADGPTFTGGEYMSAEEQEAWDGLEELSFPIYGVDRPHLRRHMGTLERGHLPNEDQLVELRAQIARPVRSADFWNVPAEAWPLIAHLGSMERLSVVASDMRGEAFQQVARMKSLRRLEIANSKCLPPDVSLLKDAVELEHLDVMFSTFEESSAKRLELIGEMTPAERAWAGSYRSSHSGQEHIVEAAILTDRMLEQLSGLTKLKTLKVINSAASERGVQALSGMAELESLELQCIDLTPEAAQVIGRLPSLQSFRYANATNETLAEFAGLPHLEDLELWAGEVTDEGVQHLLSIRSLQKLALRGSQISDAGLLELTKLPVLTLLDLRYAVGAITPQGIEAFRAQKPDCQLLIGTDSNDSEHDHDAPHRHAAIDEAHGAAAVPTVFEPFDCLLVDAATGEPLPGDGFTIHFLFKRPATADAPEETIDNLIWGPKATSRFQFLIPERSFAHPDRGKLIVQWGVGHPDYELLNPPEQVPLAQILRDDPKSARDTFRRIAMQRKKLPADAMPKTSSIVVTYSIQDAEPQTRIYVQDINGKGDIGTEEVALSKFNPLPNGGTLKLQDLDAGDYQVARYRQVEIGQVGPSRIHTGLYLDRRQFKLQAGETKSIEFVRPGGKPVSGRVEGLKKFGLDKVIVCVCSENATDPESLNSLDVTIYDVRHSDAEGRFSTERLSPGNYVILVEAYAPFKQEDLAHTGIPVPRYLGTTKITVPETGDAPAADVTLRDTQAPEAADANPPAKSRIIVHYDIPESEAVARVFVHHLDGRGDIGSVVEGPMKWNPLKNAETLELDELEVGNYEITRRRLVEIGQVGEHRVEHSVHFDRRTFRLTAGETRTINIVRPGGKPVTGRVAGMQAAGVERAIVYVCSGNATGADSLSQPDVTVFDVQPCGVEGGFVTERLVPGDYLLVFHGYTAIPPVVLSQTGHMSPRFAATARVTVPETGEPQSVEVTLQDTQQAAVGADATTPASQIAAIAAIEKLGGDVQYDNNHPDKPVIAVHFFGKADVVDSDLASLEPLTSLLEVVLTGTGVSDAGLEHLKGLSNLGSLALTKTRVTDAGLSHLEGLSRLEILELYNTAITDQGLAHLAGLTRLDLLALNNTKITDAGLVHLKGLTRLSTLDLSGTGVSDAGLEQLSGLTHLIDLRLQETNVTADGLQHLSDLTNLKTLVLSLTRVASNGLVHLQRMSKLEKLWLIDTDVDDAGLEHLRGMPSLRELVLGAKTRVTRAGVHKLQTALPDCRILVTFQEDPQASIRFNVLDETGQKAIARFRVIPGFRRMVGDPDQPTWQENDARNGRDGELLWPLTDLLADETGFLVEADGYKPQVWTWVRKADGPRDLYFTLATQPTGSLLLDCRISGGAAQYAFHWNLFKPDEPRHGASPVSRNVNAANGQRTEVGNLIPGRYQLWRVRPIRFTDWTSNYGLDYREVHIAAGQQTETQFTRGAGHRIRGRIVGLRELVGPFGGGGSQQPDRPMDDETLACILVRAADAPDPEFSRNGFRDTTFDAAPADPEGRFVTEPLEPGTYQLYAHAYRRLTEQQRVRTGDITPSWVGSATVTVPADGEPEAVEIELKRAGADESPAPQRQPPSDNRQPASQPSEGSPKGESQSRGPGRDDEPSSASAQKKVGDATLTVEARFAGVAPRNLVARLWQRAEAGAEANQTMYDSDWFDPETRILWRQAVWQKPQKIDAGAALFLMGDVSPGEFRVSVHHWSDDDWSRADPTPFGASAAFVVQADSDALTVPVTIAGDRTLVVSFVDAESREPLDDVPLTLFRSDGLPITTGNGNHGLYGGEPGRKTYRGLVPGEYALRIFDRHEDAGSRIAYGPLPERVPVSVTDTPESVITVAIPAERLTEQQIEERWPFWVYGRVSDHNGVPVPEAEITVSTGAGTLMHGGSGKTDAEGRFKVHFVAGFATRISPEAPRGVGTQAAIMYVQRDGFVLKDPAEGASLQMSDSSPAENEGDPKTRRVVRPGRPVEVNFTLQPAPE